MICICKHLNTWEGDVIPFVKPVTSFQQQQQQQQQQKLSWLFMQYVHNVRTRQNTNPVIEFGGSYLHLSVYGGAITSDKKGKK